jgi:hypothetical protein
MEFILAKPSTKISHALVRPFSASCRSILRLFILQATVSCICSSEVPKVRLKEWRIRRDPPLGRYEQLNSNSRMNRGTDLGCAGARAVTLRTMDGAFLSTDGATYEAN